MKAAPKKPPSGTHRVSAFEALGFNATLQVLLQEIQALYTADEIPWIIGYSGGKDSTAILQLVWTAIAVLPRERRLKNIYVITTDTMVENPVISLWVAKSHDLMKRAAKEQQVPFCPRLLRPQIGDSFWVNLLGKGYAAPRHKFRWCTYRLKIQPSNTFIKSMVSSGGKVILVLGTRKAESAARAANMAKREKGRVRERLSPNSSLPGSFAYTPIENWSNDDVWFYLMQVKNPWGNNNRDLLGMYAGATPDGECPVVVDTSTPSCGDSRFGCWVCTMVEADKSMSAMIHNDIEKEWMMPLLELRNLMDFRRMTGNVQLMQNGREVPGPYLQSVREDWLGRLLRAQVHIQRNGPPEVWKVQLITVEELREIRRIWVVDKHEMEDSLPRIYREATGREYPGPPLDDNLVLGEMEMRELEEICGENRLHYELVRELLSLTRQQRTRSRRVGLFTLIEKTLSRHFYDSREDALARAHRIADERNSPVGA